MAGLGKSIAGAIFSSGTRLVARATDTVLRDPRGQEAVARAVGMAQRGRRRLEEVQERFMEAAGIPGRQDYQELAKQLARLKRKARELSERLDATRERDGAAADEDEPGTR
jgi:hypothetical protein